MRAVLLVIFLTAVNRIFVGQPYVPIPSTNAIWTISTLAQGSMSGICKNAIYGDTIINNVNYKKVYENYDASFNINSPYTFYRGAIREFGKRVYKINVGTTSEKILYDFNLTIGDTAKIANAYGYVNKKKITGYNFIVYNGTVHRKWIFADGEYWLEGIGSSYGFLNSLDFAFDMCESLLCMSTNGTIMYQNSSPDCFTPAPHSCDGGFVSVNELSKNHPSISLYPNPFSDFALLKTSIELHNANLIIYDVLGQQIISQQQLNESEIKIFRENLAEGYYYYTLQNGDVIFSGNFIIR